MSKTLLPRHPDHGRNIWAFLNIRTNQVLYSLTQRLAPSALKQLPDAGANNNPASIRRDHWRPFFHVTIPSSRFAKVQGLDIYRKLREWRMVHETTWEPSALLSRPWSEEEIKELEAKLARKGGSKKMTVYDRIKTEKKKLRARAVMDQKANSVADLAAILRHQQEYSVHRAERSQSGLARERLLILSLAQRKAQGGLKLLGDQISEAKKDSQLSDRERMAQVAGLRFKIKKMLWSYDAVRETLEKIEEEVSTIGDVPTENKGNSSLVAVRDHLRDVLKGSAIEPSVESEGSEKTTRSMSDALEADLQKHLPIFPSELAPTTPKPKDRRTSDRLRKAPIYTSEGVVVRWFNVLDAEFAEAWPVDVEHTQMKATRDLVFNMPSVTESLSKISLDQAAISEEYVDGVQAEASDEASSAPETLASIVQRLRGEVATTKVLKRKVRERGWLLQTSKPVESSTVAAENI